MESLIRPSTSSPSITVPEKPTMDSRLAIRTKGKQASEVVPQKPRLPCRFHARGFCSKGTACPFGHDGTKPVSVGSGLASNIAANTSITHPISQVPCRFFAASTCAKGSSCSFLHPEDSKVESTSAPAVDQASDSRSQILCQFFSKGACRNGETCPFAHCGSDQEDKGVGEEELGQSEDNTPDNWTREIGGALVIFRDGAAISKLSLPSDFSAVHLNNLPLGSSPTSVAALILDTTGIQVTEEHVMRILTPPGGTNCSADVKMEDPTFARTLCDKMKSKSLSHGVAQFEATPITVSMPRGTTNLHRVDCKKVHCSWYRPTRTAWLNFGTENIARRVQERFNAESYKVLGAIVKASDPTRGYGIESRRNTWRNPQAWTVMLTGLPGSAKEQDILKPIPEYSRPRHVELGDPSYEAGENLASTIVRSMMFQFGPLEWWEVTGRLQGKRVKAQARFTEESDAREAVEALNNNPLSFSKTARLTVQLVTSAKFKILTRIYDVVRDRLDSEKSEWGKRHIQFIAYPPSQGYRVLKLEGEDSKSVAQAKETLGRIVGGEVAAENGNNLWHPRLGKNTVDELQKVKLIEQECRVVILRDKRKSQIRLFGPENGCKRASERLVTLIQKLEEVQPNKGRVIELDTKAFQWACRGGFRALVTLLGDNKATLDVVSTPRRVIITGSEDEYTAALAMVANKKSTASKLQLDTLQQTQDCSVCWTEAEDPIRTSCNHIYCMGCFADLSQAAGSSTAKDFCISCVGGEGLCNRVLTLSELQTHLSSTAFEDLLESSFASYVRRHPETLRYCPTPDCGQIYRPTSTTTESKTFTCPSCLIPTCTSCHAPHPGMTCADHKDVASGGYEALKRIKKKLGIKDCPKCKTAMEKTEGCNHMTCRGCGTHICWMCMEHFDKGAECYDHLNKKHGGIYDRGGVYDVGL